MIAKVILRKVLSRTKEIIRDNYSEVEHLRKELLLRQGMNSENPTPDLGPKVKQAELSLYNQLKGGEQGTRDSATKKKHIIEKRVVVQCQERLWLY